MCSYSWEVQAISQLFVYSHIRTFKPTTQVPANKNALIRYKTIDRCLRNRYRRWTIEDLTDACTEALEEMEGKKKPVSIRTVKGDLQVMRSEKLGYNAPIEVYDNKYYRYADPDYKITEPYLRDEDYLVVAQTVDMIERMNNPTAIGELAKLLPRVKEILTLLL